MTGADKQNSCRSTAASMETLTALRAGLLEATRALADRAASGDAGRRIQSESDRTPGG